jgi:hypothetical protein
MNSPKKKTKRKSKKNVALRIAKEENEKKKKKNAPLRKRIKIWRIFRKSPFLFSASSNAPVINAKVNTA